MPNRRMSGPPPQRGNRASKTNLIRIGLTTPRPEVNTISPTARTTWRRWGRKRPNTRRARWRLDTRPLGFSAGEPCAQRCMVRRCRKGWGSPLHSTHVPPSGDALAAPRPSDRLLPPPEPLWSPPRGLSRGLLLGMETLGSLPPPAALPVKGVEEGAAPEPDGEGGSEENH